jgi:hypothetical protein
VMKGATVDDEVMKRLEVSKTFLATAWAAGSGRHAVVDGYLAVDNALSALLVDRGKNPRAGGHKDKISQAFEHAASAFSALRVSEEDLDDFRFRWDGFKYSRSEVSPREAVRYLRLANRAFTAVATHLAQRDSTTFEELDEELQVRVFGYQYSLTEERLAELDHQLQWQLEVEGEQSGSKLANKVFNTNRLIAVMPLSEAQDVREAFATNEVVAGKVVDLYSTFIGLVDHLQMLRAAEGDFDRPTDFTLSIRLSYTGMTMTQMAEDFRQAQRLAWEGEPGKRQYFE